MIVGVGIDVVEIKRLERAIERFGDRFLQRVFCFNEIETCLKKTDPYPGLSARFAAKEAFSKALGTGFRNGLRLTDICVKQDQLGAPYLFLKGAAQRFLNKMGISKVHVSLSHERSFAVSVVILEKQISYNRLCF